MVNGLNEDLSLKYETVDVVEVQVRGPRETLESYKVDQNVSIDLSDYTESGSYRVPVEVKLPKGCKLERNITLNVILEDRK